MVTSSQVNRSEAANHRRSRLTAAKQRSPRFPRLLRANKERPGGHTSAAMYVFCDFPLNSSCYILRKFRAFRAFCVRIKLSSRGNFQLSIFNSICPGGHTRVHDACFLCNLYKSVDKKGIIPKSVIVIVIVTQSVKVSLVCRRIYLDLRSCLH